MSESFDAYYEWLGIAPKDQPPHHYRLLGIDLYEVTPDVIDSAVDRQMAHLRTFQTGPRAKLCQELLNKLSAARVTLLDPEKKAAYDAQLKEHLAAKSAKSKRRIARALPLEEPLATATPLQVSTPAVGTPLEVAVSGPQVRSDSSRHRGHRKKGPPWVVIGIGGALLAVVAIVTMMVMSGGDEPVAQRPKKRTPNKTVDQSVKSPRSDTVVGDEPNERPLHASKTSVEAPKKKPAPSAKVPDYLAPTDVAKRKEKPANPFAVAPIDDRPPEKFDPTPERNQPPKTAVFQPKKDPTPVAATSPLAKVPADDALKKVDVEIREIFDFKAATDLESRKKLVAEIRSTALETKTDPVGQYAMLRMARDLSAHLGDYAAAEQTINEMSERFDIDTFDMRSKAIMRSMTAKIPAEHREKVARAGLALAKEFHESDRYKEAATIITAVGRAASRLKDKQLVADTKQLAIDSRVLAKQYGAVRSAMETLKTDPDDPAANAAVGKYLCFVRGDWDRGLALLAKGNDAELKDLAAQELGDVNDAKKQVALANAWWEIGKKKETAKAKGRAIYWYKRALPGLSGLVKVKVEKRLNPKKLTSSIPMPKRINGLQVRFLDCSRGHQQVRLGGGFNVQKSWILSLEANTPNLGSGAHQLFFWGDRRSGKDVLYVRLSGSTLEAVISDCRTDAGQKLHFKLGDDVIRRWTKIQFRYDSTAPKISLYVNDKLVKEERCQLTPTLDRPMPIVLGDVVGGGQRFVGQIRSLLLTNTP